MERRFGMPGHVLFLNWRDTRNPEGGGSEVYVERVAAELVARGYRVTLFCAAHARRPPTRSTRRAYGCVRRGGRHTVYLLGGPLYLAGALGIGPLRPPGLGRPDVLVDVCNGLPFLAPLCARRPVVELIHHVHREQWPVVFGPWAARFGWWIESSARRPRSTGGAGTSPSPRRPADELAVLGVDAGAGSRSCTTAPRPLARPAPRDRRTRCCVVLGRLVPHKRVELALRAVAAARRRAARAARWWWPARAGGRSTLRELAAELGHHRPGPDSRASSTEEEKHALLASAWVAADPVAQGGLGADHRGGRCPRAPPRSRSGTPAESPRRWSTGGPACWSTTSTTYLAKVRTLLHRGRAAAEMGAQARQHAARFTWPAAGGRFAAILLSGVESPRPVQQRGEPSYLSP